VGVGDDEPDPGQAAGGQRAKEREPAGAVFLGADVQAEDFAVAVGVDPDRDQAGDVHRPPGLADLHRQRVQRHKRIKRTVERSAAERLDLDIQV
jgi:hypothetical protein